MKKENDCLGIENIDEYFLSKFPLMSQWNFFSVIFIKNFKEDVQQGYPREVKGDEGQEKIVKSLA